METDQEATIPNVYLGDGVYASFDGYYVWLAANDHHNKVVALEPAVIENLIQYVDSINKARRGDAS